MKTTINRAALVLFLFSFTFSCDSGIRSSTLVINRITDPNPTPPLNHTVHLALSRKPDFSGGYKGYVTSYEIALGGIPAVSFHDIAWDPEFSDQKAAEFWLLVADDSSAGNIGILGPDDRLLPAMRVVLRDGETTTIDEIVFDTTPSAPARLLTVPTDQMYAYTKLFIEQPALLPGATLRLRIGPSDDLNAPSFDIPIRSADLSSGFAFLLDATNPSWYGIAWLDLNNDGILDTGEWISAPLFPAPAFGAGPWILWSGQTY